MKESSDRWGYKPKACYNHETKLAGKTITATTTSLSIIVYIVAALERYITVACREAAIPKTLKEIAVANNTKRKLVAKAYRVTPSYMLEKTFNS